MVCHTNGSGWGHDGTPCLDNLVYNHNLPDANVSYTVFNQLQVCLYAPPHMLVVVSLFLKIITFCSGKINTAIIGNTDSQSRCFVGGTLEALHILECLLFGSAFRSVC